MDFAALSAIDTKTAAETGVRVPFTQLDGKTPLLNAKKEPVGVVLLGSDSDAYRRESRTLAKTRMDIMQANVQKDGSSAEVSDEQMDAMRRAEIAMLARLTVGWFGMLDSKGKDLEFSVDGAVKLYGDYPVAREQVDTAIVDRNRFIKASS